MLRGSEFPSPQSRDSRAGPGDPALGVYWRVPGKAEWKFWKRSPSRLSGYFWGSEMKSVLSNLKEVLERIEEEIRRSPSFLNDGGKGVDDPAYFAETQRLEALQAHLSRAIKELQNRPEPPGPQTVDLLKYARRIEKEMRGTWERANTRNIQEVLADASEQIHQYHEMTAVPPGLAYVPEAPGSQAGSLEGMCLFVFSVIAGYVQLRKRRKGK